MKRPNALSVLAFTLFMSMMVSAQAQAFDAGGLSYNVTDAVASTVEVTGRASGNTDTVIVIPSSVLRTAEQLMLLRALMMMLSEQQPHQRDHSRQRHDHWGICFLPNALTSVTIGNSVTTIGDYAFASTSSPA